MNTTTLKTLLRSALVVALLGVLAGTAAAQCTTAGGTTTCNLVADAYSWGTVPMWGFKFDTNQACGAGGSWAVGELLEVDLATATNLTINLRNCLLTVPVSIVVPGLPTPTTGSLPSFTTDAAGRSRVTSFTSEAAENGGLVTYSWTGVKPGTFLYHSGSDLATQVHMGLYGVLVVDQDRVNGIAYPDNPKTAGVVDPVTYDVDAIVVMSEIDPALHNPVATAAPLTFKPKYFLVNGVADGSASLTGAAVNDKVLFRFVNAGLLDYAPTLLGEDMAFVAEDANPYTYPFASYGELLAAGKTLDALWTPVSAGIHALYDRRLHMSTNGEPGGGLVASIDVASALVPIADAGLDKTGVAPGDVVTLTGSATLGTAPYSYDWSLVGFPAGSAAWLATGSCSFDLNLCSAAVPCAVDTCDLTMATPTCTVSGAACTSDADCSNDCTPFTPTISGGSDVKFTADVPGAYTAQLVVTDNSGATSAPDSVNVFTNRPPVAIATATSPVNVGSLATLDGSGSYDPDGTALSYAWTLTVPAGSGATLSSPTADNPTFTADVVGDYVAQLTVSDGSLTGSDTVTVTAVVPVNQPPVAVEDHGQVTWWTNTNNGPTSVAIDVVANDTDPDCASPYACIDRGSVIIVTPPSNGTITSVLNGIVTYSPNRNWRGSEFFRYQVCDDGGLCATAGVQVDVTK